MKPPVLPRHVLRARLEALARRLRTRLPRDAAIWAEPHEETRGELRLLAPRDLKPFIRKLMERTP